MTKRDQIKTRVVNWILRHGFNQVAEKAQWKTIAPQLRSLVDAAYQRCGQRVREMEREIAEVPESAPLRTQIPVMRTLLSNIVSDAILDEIRAAHGEPSAESRDRLHAFIERHFSNSRHLRPLFAVVRRHLGHARPGDEVHYQTFYQTALAEENQAMDDIVDLARFAFDTSSLPDKFKQSQPDPDGYGTVYPEQQHFVTAVTRALKKLGNDGNAYVAATVGLLLVEGQTDYSSPSFFKQIQRLYAELSGSADPGHKESLNGAHAFIPNGDDQRIAIYQHAYQVLVNSELGEDGQLFFQDFARLGRKAASAFKTRPPGTAGFTHMVLGLFRSGVIGDPLGDGSGGGIGRVELPPLNDPNSGSDEIAPDNIRAVATIYVGFQLEQMHFFQATDRVVELFMAGLLPIGYDEGARKLDHYYWASDDRLDEAARWSQYSRALGASGGQVSQEVNPNLEFNTLLLRFISSVSEFERQQSIGSLFDQRGSSRSLSLSAEYVRKAGRDLAANISLYGWAGTYFTAERITRQIGRAMDILQLHQVQQAYGVNSPWQVIERVAQRELGNTVNVVKHRTLADETRKILNLVADKHAIWGLSSYRPLFTLGHEVSIQQESGDLSFQETQSLFRAVQYWLAVNGVQDATVDQYRQPTETVAAPSLPPLGFNGSGGKPGVDPAGINQLKDMVSQGQMPSMDQLSALLSGQ